MIPKEKIGAALRRAGKTRMTAILVEAQHGIQLEMICAAVGISRSTYFRLRHMNPGFKAQLDRILFSLPSFRGLPR